MTPQQKPGRSKQDYATPLVLLHAVQRRLGIGTFACDLAATATNTVAIAYYDLAANALDQSWVCDGWCWCNPPFARLAPWVRRAVEQSRLGAHVAMLVPAGVGADWWRDHVHGHALALFLNGRVVFVGETKPYPKDCVLLLYGPDVAPGYDIWTWRVPGAEAQRGACRRVGLDTNRPRLGRVTASTARGSTCGVAAL